PKEPSVTFPPRAVVAAVALTATERRDPPDLKRAQTVEKGHGRIETRRIAVRTRLPSRLDQNWPGITAICRIERIRELKDRCSRQVIYAITSLAPPVWRRRSSSPPPCCHCPVTPGPSKT